MNVFDWLNAPVIKRRYVQTAHGSLQLRQTRKYGSGKNQTFAIPVKNVILSGVSSVMPLA